MTEANNTRDQIITFATELFLTKGFKSVTMDDLASDMAMSKKTIYTYFKTKKDLIHASANHIFQSIADGIEVICNLALNPIEELFTINDFVFKHLKNESSSPEYQLLKYYPKVHGHSVSICASVYGLYRATKFGSNCASFRFE